MSQHYSIACVRLAEETGLFPGAEILRRSVETTLLAVLQELIRGEGRDAGVRNREDRAEICRKYWAACGMGDLRFVRCAADGGVAEMRRSQVDEGWRRARERRDRPVNLLTQGFLAAAWSAIGDEPAGAYRVRETESLVSGAPASIFVVERKE